jgi:hypothetical protein
MSEQKTKISRDKEIEKKEGRLLAPNYWMN